MMPNASRWLFVAGVFALSGSGPSIWRNEDSNREDLPELKTIPAASTGQLTPASGWPSRDDLCRWERSHGSAASTRYSALQQINRDNVTRLGVAWQYHSKDGTGNIQCNPIVVGGTLFAPTVGHHIVALNAATGVEVWRYRAGNSPAFRGLAYWRGTLF